MRLKQRRDRVVLFRLTAQEHLALEALCAAKGGRSLSEFVRVEVLNPARYGDIEGMRKAIGAIERRLASLEGKHDDLALRIEALRHMRPTQGLRAEGVGQA